MDQPIKVLAAKPGLRSSISLFSLSPPSPYSSLPPSLPQRGPFETGLDLLHLGRRPCTQACYLWLPEVTSQNLEAAFPGGR